MTHPKYPSPYEHVTHAQQFTPAFLFELFALTDKIKSTPDNYTDTLRGHVVATLFYEPSTRTRLSFESAVTRLGGTIIATENAAAFSSAAKGETLEDSIRVISAYCDMIVLRHNEDDASKKALAHTNVPLINAGSGKSQHPTQALLDVYTIYEHFGRLDNLHVAVVGDLAHGRTCDSLVYMLAKFPENRFSFVSPANCRVKDSLKEHLREHDIPFDEKEDSADVLTEVDVLYVTRIQKERFDDPAAYETAKGSYSIDMAAAATMRPDAIIMHPLPRIDEITTAVDADPRALYFQQAANGLYVRMALLTTLRTHAENKEKGMVL